MEIIIPFTGWGRNIVSDDSFLFYFPENKLYIFDNHRLSLWCWLSKIKDDDVKKPNLLYLDRHIDFRCTDFKERYEIFKKNEDNINDLNIFRKMPYKLPLSSNSLNIDYGNFLAFASKLDIFNNIFIFTEVSDCNYFEREFANSGTMPFDISNISVFNSDIAGNLSDTFSNNSNIYLDVDLDFFVVESSKTINHKLLNSCISVIKNNLSKVNIMTIALSQSFCGGEDKALEILGCFIDAFGVNLELDVFNKS